MHLSQDVEIKKMGGTATYGFVLYYDLASAITAKKYMDGHNIKGNNIRVGKYMKFVICEGEGQFFCWMHTLQA